MIEKSVEIILLLVASAGIVVIILASVYDIMQIRSESALRKLMHRLTTRHQPHVTIIISEIDTVSELHGSLRQIKNNHYKSYDVVAIVKKATVTERRQIVKTSPIEKLSIYAPRGDQCNLGVIVRAYRKGVRGEMAVILTGRDRLDPYAIKRSVALLQNPKVDSVRFYGEVKSVESMLQLYGAFADLSSRMVRKALDALGIAHLQLAGHSGIYRTEPLLLAAKKNIALRTSDSRALAPNEITQTILTKHMRWYNTALHLVFIALVIYGAASAALLQSPLPLILMWAIVSLWLLAVIWSGSQDRVASKLALSICVPIGMFVIAAAYLVSGPTRMFSRKAF